MLVKVEDRTSDGRKAGVELRVHVGGLVNGLRSSATSARPRPQIAVFIFH